MKKRNKQMYKSLFISTFLVVLLSACTSGGDVVPVNQFSKPTVQTIDSGKVSFSNIDVRKTAEGIKVSGNVKRRSPSIRRVSIHGHIHIILNSPTKEPIEILKANTHRKYGNSKYWHFDGVLKTPLPENSSIVVKYHASHS